MGEPLLLQLLVASSIPVLKILLICAIGAFCARKGLLTPEGRRVLGALSFLVFNPALIFVKLASTLTPTRLVHWWPLVLNTGISTAVGLGLGYLGVRLVRPPHPLRAHTVVAIALGNLGNLPLVIVSTLATSSAEVLHGIPASRAEDLAVSYVVVGLLVPVIAHATIGFSMLRKPSAFGRPEAVRSEDGPDSEPLQTTGTAAPTTLAAAAPTAADDDGPAAPGRCGAVRSTDQEGGDVDGDGHFGGGLAVVVDAGEQQKRPLLAEHRAMGCAGSSCIDTCVELIPRSGGGRGGSGGGRPLPHISAISGGGATVSRASGNGTSMGAAMLMATRVSSHEIPGSVEEGLVAHSRQQPYHPQPRPHAFSHPPGHPHLRPKRSSSGVLPGAPDEAVQLCGYAVDCLGSTDGDPLGEPLPQSPSLLLPPRQQRQHLVSAPGPGVQERGRGLLGAGKAAEADVTERHKGQPALTGVGAGPGQVELPSPAGAGMDRSWEGHSMGVGRSAFRCRTLGRLFHSLSGQHRLLEWRSRVDGRALGRQILREVTSPPLLAILLSVPVGCVRPLQAAFFGGGAAGRASLGLLTDCLSMLGECTIPAILLLLGATLANGPGAVRVPLRVIGLVNATRLALLPLLGLGLVMGAYAARLFEAPDPIYLLVLLIQNTAPTAIMVHTMASVHGNRAEEVSSILFWGYIAGIAVIPMWLTLFLFVVKQQFRYVAGGGDGGDPGAAFVPGASG